jgi:GH18 family chitinase
VPEDLQGSWRRAKNDGHYDEIGGGHYYHDDEEHIWWSWDTRDAIGRKFSSIVESSGIGGVFAWGLGEDGDAWDHLKAMNLGVESWQERMKGTHRRCGTEDPPADWFREEL